MTLSGIPTPGGAICAQHPGMPAPSTCTRCGNFMCAICSVDGAESLCPACRELSHLGDFKLRRDDWDFSRLWDFCWALFKRDWLNLGLAALVLMGAAMAMSFVGQLAQLAAKQLGGTMVTVAVMGVTQILSSLVQGFFQMGMAVVVLEVLRGGKIDVAKMFSQMPNLGRYVIQVLLIVLVFLLPLLAYLGVLYGVAGAMAGTFDPTQLIDTGVPTVVAVFGLGMLVALVPLFYFGVPLSFATLELVNTPSSVSPWQVIKNTFVIARDHRWTMVGVSMVAGLVTTVGLMACCIGVLPALGLAQLLVAGLYLTLREGSGLSDPAL